MIDEIPGASSAAAPTGSDFSMVFPCRSVTRYRYRSPTPAPSTQPLQTPLSLPVSSRSCDQASNDPATATRSAFGAQTANRVPPSPGCAPKQRCRYRCVPSPKRNRSRSSRCPFTVWSFRGDRGVARLARRRASPWSVGRVVAARSRRRLRPGRLCGRVSSIRSSRSTTTIWASLKASRSMIASSSGCSGRASGPRQHAVRRQCRRRAAGSSATVANGAMSWVRTPATERRRDVGQLGAVEDGTVPRASRARSMRRARRRPRAAPCRGSRRRCRRRRARPRQRSRRAIRRCG